MTTNERSLPPAPSPGDRRRVFAVAVALVVATFLAYANTFRAPLEFDDKPSLADNPTIRQLWPLSIPLSPPTGLGLTVEGRPLLNLSFAINYALGGTDLRGYHIVNLAIHILAGLALFGLIRRTLLTPRLRDRYGRDAASLATIGALFWVLHPLQVESVTYLVQRAESLAGLFFLLTFYAFVRAAEPLAVDPGAIDNRRAFHRGWFALAVLTCLCGMATKEVMVVAPVLIFLYDRTFLAGSFRGAWRQRRTLHLGLAATWVLLGWLVLRSGSRGETFALADPYAWWRYGLTQFLAVVRYLKLAVWPHPLVFDYGKFWVTFADVVPQACVVIALLAAVGYAAVRGPVYGFFGVWFFATLAPSSVLPGTLQMIVEHRMYLPLAAGAMLVVHAAILLAPRMRAVVTLALAIGLVALTHARNDVFRSGVRLWTDTVAKVPGNARAVGNLGTALLMAGRSSEALERFTESVRLDPLYLEGYLNLGLVHMEQHRPAEAVRAYAEAARIKPSFAPTYYKQAIAFTELGRRDEAIAALEQAVAVLPRYAAAHCSLGLLLSEAGRPDEATKHLRIALEVQPDYVEAEAHLGLALLNSGRADEALRHLEHAIALDPNVSIAHFNLGLTYAALGRNDDAAREYRETVRLNPDDGEAHLNLGVGLAQSGHAADALPELERAVKLVPASPEAHQNLGNVLAELERFTDAAAHYETALKLRPTYASAHYNYGNTLLMLGRIDDATAQFKQALACDPGFAAAREMLDRIRSAPR